MKFSESGEGAKKVYKVDNKVVTQEEFDRLMAEEKAKLPQVEGGEPGSCFCSFKPMRNQALAVHPHQVEQARERAKRHGIGVDYAPTGHVLITSREEYRKLMALECVHNNDGSYGDDPRGAFQGHIESD